jgi:hypothetical protein
MNRTSMNAPVMTGAVLVLLGLLGLAVPFFSAQQTKDVAKIGDLKLQTTETTTYAIPHYVSGGALALGIVLVGAGLIQKR